MTHYTQIGSTKKTHGVSGELKVAIEEAYEEVFLEADRVFLEVRGTKLPFFIEHIRGGGEWIVQFDDVPTREDALLLQGRGIFLPTGELPQNSSEAPQHSAYAHIAGYRITDLHAGEIGVVQEILEMPQQEMARVQYQGREVLIPLNAEFVKSVNDKARQLLVDLPEGLLAL